MSDPLFAVKQFLKKHFVPSKPLLLGFSGGPDSLALLHLLLKCRRAIPFELHLAHVDHGWREESGKQAKELCALSQELGLPFHLHVLKEQREKDLESWARNERLHFFKNLYQKLGCQALLLGHHLDDHAETVLKRLLEGASLQTLCGIKPVSSLTEMQIWRPLLTISKQEILNFLDNMGLQGIDDPTNRDPRFLRARLRQEVFPFLSQAFGKQFSHNLCRLGESSQELSEYIEERISPFFQAIEEGPFGKMIDFNRFGELSKFELGAFLKKLAALEECFFSHQSLKAIQEFILQKGANKYFDPWVVDRGFLFVLKEKIPLYIEDKVEITTERISSYLPPTDWKEFFLTGKATIAVPLGDYQLISPVDNTKSSLIKERFNKHKVPAFFRDSLPIIYQDEKVIHEFLTGKSSIISSGNYQLFTIKIKKFI